jgi:hypothetical protein
MDDEINIRLELKKYKNENLSIVAYFDSNSANFYKDGDYFLWKPTQKEKEFIVDAFRLINSNTDMRNSEKIFKFSDKMKEDNENFEQNEPTNFDSEKKIEDNINDLEINSKSKVDQDIVKINQDNIINKTLDKNLNNDSIISEDEREKKIEKILNENRKNNY